ncbi:MAG TPA: MFS transporter [Xanthobacteraceae bacterium]|nr:MFS transporter [Xanthobacteraceae bacterium]
MPLQTRWGAAFVLIFAGVISALQIGKAAIAVPILQRELALTLVAASWIVGAYGMVGAIAGLPAGILSSLFSARATLIAGLTVAGIGSLAGAFAGSETILIATRVMEGCGSLAAALAVPRLLRAVTAPKDLAQVLALFAAHLPFGSVVMMLVGPHVMSFGWQALWIINGAIVLAYAAVIAGMRIDEATVAQAAPPSVLTNIGAVLGKPGPVLLALAFGTYTFQYLALAGLMPALLVDRMGLSIAAAGTVSAIAVAANAVGNMSAGALLRWGVPVWSILAGAFAFVGLAAIGIFSDAAPVALVVTLAALSLGLTGLIPGSIYAAAPRIAPTSALLAIALGLINQVTNLGNLAGPAAMAFTVQSLGWSGAPLLFAGVAVTGVTAALLLRRVLRGVPAG